MLDIFSGALASAKTASEMGKSLLELRDAEKVRSAVFELRNQLMDLQERVLGAKEEQMRLLERIAQLEAQLKEANDSASEHERYERHRFPTGAFAYRLKQDHQGGEPEYYLCSKCFEGGQRITMHSIIGLYTSNMMCPSCKTTIEFAPAKPYEDTPIHHSY